MPEVRQDVADRMTGEHNDAMARVDIEVQGWSPERIVETFFTELKMFSRKLGHYADESRWSSGWVNSGKSYL